MNRRVSLLAIIFLSLNVLVDPLIAVSKVYGQEEDYVESSLIMEAVSEEVQESSEEPVIEETVEEVYESDIVEEVPVEETVEESEVVEESEESQESEESSEEEDKEAVTFISFNGGATDNLYTGSEFDVPVLISNSSAELENAVLRYTVSGEYIEEHGSLSAYFPYASKAASDVYWTGSNLIVEYDLGTLSQEYSGGPSLLLKTIDNGSMRHGSQVSVVAEVLSKGQVVAQTSYRNYNFVTRQPHFTTNVITKDVENSDDDEEGPSQQVEMSFAFDFDQNGVGNGSGQSAVTNIKLVVDVPEALTFNSGLNDGWAFDEASRQATYSFTPDASIYSSGYTLPANLVLDVAEASEDVRTSLYSEVLISFENGDSVIKTNQPELMIEASALMAPFAEVGVNLITGFTLEYTTGSGEQVAINNGDNIEVDLNDMNAVLVTYTLVKPNELDFNDGDTYRMPLPAIAHGITANNKPIVVNDLEIGTYSIIGEEVVITFNENVNEADDVNINVNISGEFNIDVFEATHEVVVQVPFSDGSEYTATIRAEQEEYDGVDLKEAGSPYILGDGGDKISADRNPTHIDWTVRVNDSMLSVDNAILIDELGEHLEIVEGSFIVERIIRNHKNEEIGREVVGNVSPTLTDGGFELGLGSIEDAYDITYTTTVSRPDGGGTHTFNNKARIILDGESKDVSDSFQGTWSGDLPTITKDGSLEGDDRIKWRVQYNFGHEQLGTVNLTDVLSEGEIDLDSVVAHEVQADIDGNIISTTPVTIAAELDDEGNVVFPGLDADGKAYLIEFSSHVPVGINGTIINTVTDNLPQPNADDASVDVNTIPTGDKVGEQGVDEEGHPYIDWTITMNPSKVDVPTINVKDVFNKTHLKFDVNDSSLFRLERDGEVVENFSIEDYTHTDGRSGFELNIPDAGPHEYKFIYRTYYTTLGMQQPQVANQAELVFADGEGVGIGDAITPEFGLEGPKAGIDKYGKYVLNEDGIQEILWTVRFNQSKILLESPKISDVFTTGNYSLIEGTLTITDVNGVATEDYTATYTDNGFDIQFNSNTNAEYIINFRTTVDDVNNLDHTNEATLTWQGGVETDTHTVGRRHPGISKSGDIVLNDDGTKRINWTIDFNTNSNIIHNFELVDTYSPATATVSNLAVTSGGADVTGEFGLTYSEGSFTLTKERLEATSYQLTYSTTLSAEEEYGKIKNIANITYTGGSDSAERSLPSPKIAVDKVATSIDRDGETKIINWEIKANTDSTSQYVNLVNAVLTDTIPEDQRFVEDSIQVVRADGTNVTESSTISTSDNEFTIGLPNGPYTYTVSYQTEILTFPSADPNQMDRYNNSVVMVNQPGTSYESSDSATAFASYFGDGSHNNTGKSGEQNEDTENVDWELTVNPQGLPINNAVISDKLSNNHTYVKGSVKLFNANDEDITSTVDVVYGDDNRSFSIKLGNINETFTMTYSTRLDAHLIGFYNVKNTVQLTGGVNDRVISTTTKSTKTQQWFFGGGGSGRTLDMNFTKVDADNNEPLEGVKFSLYRVKLDGTETHLSDFTTTAGGTHKLLNQRAGRYILREKATLPDYVTHDDIYFVYGYAKDGSYTIDLADRSWNPDNFITLDGSGLVITNEKQKTSVTAKKVWVNGPTEVPTVYFQLYRQVGDGSAEIVEGAELKELTNGTTSVTWDNLVAKDPSGADYVFTVREVDAEGNDYTPAGFTKVEDGLTVTNTANPTELTVSKVWDDANNQDNIRPENVQIQLTANGKSVGEAVTLNEDNSWTHTFTDLAIYDQGTAIEYSVIELDLAPEYEASVSTDENGNLILTNSYSPAVTSVSAKKVWDDANNQDGIRPSSVLVQLYANDEAYGDPVELNAYNAWTTTWGDLAVNVAGKAIDYRVEEVEVPEGYEVSQELIDGIVVLTNTHAPEVKDIPVNKVWDDADNQDGLRPDSVTVNLLADGEVVDTVELSEANEWRHNFADLPVYSKGQAITYTVTENTVENYSTEINGGTVTNHYTPDETSVTVTKNWQDGQNQDGNRPDSIEVQLTANGKATDHTATLNDDNQWTATWSGLALNANGEAIDYSVVELSPEGYDVTIDDADHGNIIIMNAYTPEVTELTVNKVWDDDNNRDGVRADSIQVQLIADGQNFGEVVELNASNDWSHTWTDLAVNAAGQAIDYQVIEVDALADYDVTISDIVDNVVTITNKHDVKLRDITATKVWDDADNQDGIRPDSVTVQLYADGEAYGDPVELNADNDWTTTWTDLYVNAAGQAVDYTVEEVEIPEGYALSQETVDGVTTLTNTHVPAVTSVSAKKVWDDADNQDGIRPSSVLVQLYANDEAYGDPVELNADNAWTTTWGDLAVNAAGKAIDYRVEEVEVPEGYEVSQELIDGIVVLTNTHAPEVKDIPVNKVWDDADNQDGLRPDSVTVNLLADGEVVDTVELSEANNWQHNFADLPVYSKGQAITYTVTENTVENYSTEINGGTVTNHYTPDETSVTVTKNWQDGQNQDGNRPDSIEVQLTANGEATDHTATLNDDNQWTATWSGLALNANGEAIDYSVVELSPEGYDVTIDDADHGNIIITNAYTPKVTELTVNKVWDDVDNIDNLRPESIEVQLISGDQTVGEPVELNAANDWTYTWTDLAVFASGEEIVYTVSELDVPADYVSVISEVVDNTITVTNSRERTPRVSVGDYVWIDENKDGLQDETDIPLAGVVLTLEDSDGNPVTDVNGNPVGPQTTDENGYYSFDDLPADKTYIVRIDREASAKALEGLEPTQHEVGGDNSVDSSTWEATSRHLTEDGDHDSTLDFGFVRTPILVDVVGEKVWADNDNEFNSRPDSIILDLVVNEEVIDSVEVTEADNGQWTFAFVDLPTLDEGEEYEVRERAVDGYESSVTVENGVVIITNTYIPTTPTPTVFVDLQARKALEGRKLTAKEFSFQVLGGDTEVSRANNAEDGTVSFHPILITEEGTYEYTIREVIGKDDTVIYDENVYKVTVEVTSHEDQLLAEITYHTDNGDVPSFVNKVKLEDPKKPGKPTNKGRDLPATGELKENWINIALIIIGLALLVLISYKPKRRDDV